MATNPGVVTWSDVTMPPSDGGLICGGKPRCGVKPGISDDIVGASRSISGGAGPYLEAMYPRDARLSVHLWTR